MFRDFLDALLQYIKWFIPFTVIDAYDGAIVLRFGRFHRELKPGFHLLVPGVERVLREIVVARVENLEAQSLTTKDGVTMVAGAIVTFSITDIKKALLDVTGVITAIRDACTGEIAEHVKTHDWATLHRDSLLERVAERCNERAATYGIKIERVRLSDMAKARVMRLHIDQNNIYRPQDLTDD